MSQAVEFTPKVLLITGGAGFIGCHVVELIVKKYPQYKVVVLDCLDYCSSLKNLDCVKDSPNFKFIKGDICSFDLVRYVIETEHVDTIMHFAAQTHVDLSFGNSVKFTQTNIVGTHMMLEAARVHLDQIKRFVHVSTDEVYGENEAYDNPDDVKTEHLSALDPTNPYAASKAGAEMLVKSYGRSFKLPYVITRGNNVYGPKQFPEKLIPKMAMMLKTGRKLTVHGDGMAKRSYLHVDDVAAAFDRVLHYAKERTVVNIGTNKEQTVLSTVERIIGLVHPGSDVKSHIQHVRDRNFNDSRYFLGTNVLEDLGWTQKVDFDTGLKRTVEWFMEHGQSYWSEGQLNSVLVPHPIPTGAGQSPAESAAKKPRLTA